MAWFLSLFILFISQLSNADDSGFFSAPDLSQFSSELNWSDPEWPLELVPIQPENYSKNSSARFCTRPLEMVDTVVIHHSETPPSTTATEINSYHLARGTAEDPWYMIAYSYVINSPYAKMKLPETKVTVGRPLEIVGAHAGSNAFVPMDDEQLKMWKENKIVCGKENEEFKLDPALIQNDKIKANVTTLGIVVVGNYAPFSQDNPNGYSRRNPRYPTKQTQDTLARLSCQLQKKYPRIKNIKWHNFYHSTTCPGNLKNYIGQIKSLAKEYGCTFY
jgi:hypothetical protein